MQAVGGEVVNLITSAEDHLNLANARSIARKEVIDAPAHQPCADLRHGELQLSLLAKGMATDRHIGAVFREVLNRRERQRCARAERDLTTDRQERGGGASRRGTAADLFHDRGLCAVAKVDRDAGNE